ncbi:hypothetical protein PTNB29_02098 [Pyrenophora teres f. teres]|nr:hypothetical protein PTNB29_02098 [Pyrenophora teres f. teres]
MRLLRAMDMQFSEFEGNSTPPYAILSHRWESEEVTYQELRLSTRATRRKAGYKKIQQSCQQALKDGIRFVWVDTCCIDKTSSSELSEAINSMYEWYQKSQVCYAYLSDVQTWPSYKAEDATGHWVNNDDYFLAEESNLRPMHEQPILLVMKSKWWTRGWTLQELIAPRSVTFYVNAAHGWNKIGTKISLVELVASRTGINHGVLRGQNVNECSIAERLSWASERQTTRTEDLAYCLLGIVGVNMPLLYGEGAKAFLRLQVGLLSQQAVHYTHIPQEEIMKQTDDQTLFAWQIGFETMQDDVCGPLASHPSKFRGAGNLIPTRDVGLESPYSMTNKGLRIEIPVIHWDDGPYGVALLNCSIYNSASEQLALPVVRLGPPGSFRYARDARHIGPLSTVYSGVTSNESHSKMESAPRLRPNYSKTMTIYMKQEPGHRVQRSSALVVSIPDGSGMFYYPICWSAVVRALSLERQDSLNRRGITYQYTPGSEIYILPADHRRGAVLMQGKDRSHLLVIFNAEMENLGRYACKILYSPPLEPRFLDIFGIYRMRPPALRRPFTPGSESITSNSRPYPRAPEPSTSISHKDEITPSQKSVQDLANTVLSALQQEDGAVSRHSQGLHAQLVLANEVDRNSTLSLMHDHYSPSNSRHSFTQCHGNFIASAHIGPSEQIGTSVMVLNIEFTDLSDDQGLLHELEG